VVPLAVAPAPAPDLPPAPAAPGSCDDGIDGDGDGTFDGADVDAGGTLDPQRRCDQVRAPVASPPPAAPAPMRLACTTRRGDGTTSASLRAKPRQCSIRRESGSRSTLAGLTKATWRNWGKDEASARATLLTSKGTRSQVTVRAYRPRPDCTGTFRVYTRVQITVGGRRTTYKPATCARVARRA
jgi:hypothetical protein